MDDADQTTSSSQAVDTAQQVDFLVKQFLGDINRMREELKEQRAMLKDVFENDTMFRDVSNQIKDLTKKKKEIQKALADKPSVKDARETARALQENLKTVEKKLSEYLEKYVETYKSKTIEDPDGNLKQIITIYKLVSKPNS